LIRHESGVWLRGSVGAAFRRQYLKKWRQHRFSASGLGYLIASRHEGLKA
jgi:hypothetical protein